MSSWPGKRRHPKTLVLPGMLPRLVTVPMTATDAANAPRYFRRDAAARYVRETWGLPCSTRWLAKLAVVDGGPIYRKAGRTPIYAPADLDAWAQARIGAPQKSSSAKA